MTESGAILVRRFVDEEIKDSYRDEAAFKNPFKKALNDVQQNYKL
jgi:hypothetical protein